MCIEPSRSRGFTLIELIIFIVIVSTALAGVIAVFGDSIRGSADPVRDKQAMAAAESLLEEILNKHFCDPDTATAGTPVACGANTVEADRSLYDAVVDYDSYNSNPSGLCAAAGNIGIKDATSSATVVLANYDASVAETTNGVFTVGGDAVAVTNYRIVTVTVRDCLTNRNYSLTGYAFNND